MDKLQIFYNLYNAKSIKPSPTSKVMVPPPQTIAMDPTTTPFSTVKITAVSLRVKLLVNVAVVLI